MYSVVIVDDEPAAVKYLSAIIKKSCPDFEVVSTANDGYKAIELIKELHPDLLCFDIRMPGIDGIELSKRVREFDEELKMVAISGYAEFTYVKEVMKNKVVDYIVKPAIPKDVRILFEKIKNNIQNEIALKRNSFLRQLRTEKVLPADTLKKCFQGGPFYLALARKKGFPMKFTKSNSQEIYSDRYEQIYSYGRDENESLYIFPKKLLLDMNFKEVLLKRTKKDFDKDGYYTVVYCEETVELRQLQEVVRELYQVLDFAIVFGENTIVNYKEVVLQKYEIDTEEKQLWMDFSIYNERDDNQVLKTIVNSLLTLWKKKRTPLAVIEQQVRRLGMLRNMKEESYNLMDELNLEIEDLFYNINTYEELENGLNELLFKKNKEKSEVQRLDTGRFVEKISIYIQRNLQEELNMQNISDYFGLAPNYLGRLFRKHKNITLNKFITSSRMERAKLLLESNPEILVKELAFQVGYQDQFYFSRVFRSYTGKSPSEYLQEIIKE